MQPYTVVVSAVGVSGEQRRLQLGVVYSIVGDIVPVQPPCVARA